MFGMGLMMLLGLLLLAAGQITPEEYYERESALRDGDPPARGRR